MIIIQLDVFALKVVFPLLAGVNVGDYDIHVIQRAEFDEGDLIKLGVVDGQHHPLGGAEEGLFELREVLAGIGNPLLHVKPLAGEDGVIGVIFLDDLLGGAAVKGHGVASPLPAGGHLKPME